MKNIFLFTVLMIVMLGISACNRKEEPAPTTPANDVEPAEDAAQAKVEEPIPEAVEESVEEPAAPQLPPPMIGQQSERLRDLNFAPFEEELANFSAEREQAIEAMVLDTTIPEVQALMEAGDLTSEELTLFFLSRIRQYDDALRTYAEINPNALDEARTADELRSQGTVLGSMHGIPINLKDNIETTAPLHTTGGAEILFDHIPAQDAPLVTQLRDAGAVILGKANLSELAGGVALFPAGYSAVAGQTINPHGVNFPTLGSSSGSGASTAGYLAMASVGSETAGSLIAPSALDGVVGMYPTDDLVSDEGGIPLVSSTDTPGPIARTVTDAAILLGIIDSAEVDYTAALDANALNGVTVGFLAADLLPGPGLGLNGFEDTSDQEEKLEKIAEILESIGTEPAPAEIVRVDGLIPSDETLQLMFGPTLEAQGISLSELDEETLSSLQNQVPVKSVISVDYFAPLLNGALAYDMVGYLVDAGAPITSLADLQSYNNEMPERRIPNGQFQVDTAVPVVEAITMDSYEQLAETGQQVAASALDATFEAYGAEILVSMVNEHSSFYALAGYPAITVPLGLRANGSPTGVTLIGKPGQDAQLLAYAYAFEQASMLRENPDLDATIQQID